MSKETGVYEVFERLLFRPSSSADKLVTERLSGKKSKAAQISSAWILGFGSLG